MESIVRAWRTPLVGHPEVSLYETICDAYSAIEAAKGREQHYANTITVLQSSGTGKSRMAHELSNIVFTVPVNVRPPTDRISGGAYPNEDNFSLQSYLVQDADGALEEELELRYDRFLSIVFLCARTWLVRNCGGMKYHQKVHAWNSFLAKNRFKAYGAVADILRDRLSEITEATVELRALLAVLNEEHDNPPSAPSHLVSPPFTDLFDEQQLDEARRSPDVALELTKKSLSGSASSRQNRVELVVYFDEYHVFADVDLRKAAAGYAARTKAPRFQSAYEVLLSVFDSLRTLPIFGVFLSTRAHSTQFDRYGEQISVTHNSAHTQILAPYTALPFDCDPSLPLRGDDDLSWNDVCSISFMAKFGRPLFWTLINGGMEPESVMTLAFQKLAFRADALEAPRRDAVSLDAIAVLDVRLCFDFDHRREESIDIQAQLVSHHMRLAYVVPARREYFHSGYSSEPFLAAAAATMMRVWKTRDWGNSWLSSLQWEPEQTLRRLQTNGWIDFGPRGEVVGRLLLTLAYDKATALERRRAHYGCSVDGFLNQLFADPFAEKVLSAYPDSGPEFPETADNKDAPQKLSDAFKGAVVRFTHCVKLGDASGLTPVGLCAAFIRGMAFIGPKGQQLFDFIIPILLDSNQPIVPENMSAVLVQFTRCLQRGALNQYDFTAEELELFDGVEKLRPYITIVMELEPTTTTTTTTTTTSTTPSTAYSAKDAQHNTTDRGCHPRYNFLARGCSSAVYRVIRPDSDSNATYADLLAPCDALGDHPNHAAIGAVWNMKPAWVSDTRYDNSYAWFGEVPRGDDGFGPDDEGVVVFAAAPGD